ncbi:MAG: hypothetical protein ACM3OC_03485 [Deltaproteobacteria bacterium]
MARGFTVCHITGRRGIYAHKLTPFARVRGTVITYPKPEKT